MQISTELVGDIGVIRVRGEVDSIHAPKLDEAATELLGNGARSLVIDCSDIDFIDSTGLDVMIRTYKHAQAQGGTVTIRRPSAFTHRLLQTVGLDTVLIIDGFPEPDGTTVA